MRPSTLLEELMNKLATSMADRMQAAIAAKGWQTRY